MSKIKAKVSLEPVQKEKKSLLVIIIAAVLAVAIVAGATLGILAACGVFTPAEDEESSSSAESTEYKGEDNEVDIEDLVNGLT